MTQQQKEDQQETQTNEGNTGSRSRRNFLRTAAITAAGAAGFAGGRLTSNPDPPQTIPAAQGAPRFTDNVVLITGATSGIGKAAAKAFAAEGATVGFCGRRKHRGEEVESQIRAQGGEATYVKADVRVEEQVEEFITAIVGQYGGLDVTFSNAGVHLDKPLHEVSTSEWGNVLHTNLWGAYFTMKYAIPHMLEAGGGNILVTSSINALQVRAGYSAYCASKHALVGLVKTAALDYGPQGIRVNAILPGVTNTEMVRRLAGMMEVPDAAWEAAAGQWAKSNVPAKKRMAEPEEIAAFALDLASDRHPMMTGAAQVIDGGQSASL